MVCITHNLEDVSNVIKDILRLTRDLSECEDHLTLRWFLRIASTHPDPTTASISNHLLGEFVSDERKLQSGERRELAI